MRFNQFPRWLAGLVVLSLIGACGPHASVGPADPAGQPAAGSIRTFGELKAPHGRRVLADVFPDEVANALPLTVGASGTIDMTQATIALDDPGACGSEQQEKSVWLKFTAEGFTQLILDLRGSDFSGTDYAMSVQLFTGPPDATSVAELTGQGCYSFVGGDERVSVFTTEATTFYYMVSPSPGGSATRLAFNLRPLQVPVGEVKVTTVTVNPKTNEVTVSGTVTSDVDGFAGVSFNLQQKAGRFVVKGGGGGEPVELVAGVEVPWSGVIRDEQSSGQWSAGPGTLNVSASLCVPNEGCDRPNFVIERVQIKGSP